MSIAYYLVIARRNFMLKHYENEDFKNLISKDMVLVDFFATWCGPCKMLSPVLEQLASEVTFDIIKVDVDKSEDLAREFGIMSVPTLILFKNGEVIKRQSGFVPKEEIKEWIEA